METRDLYACTANRDTVEGRGPEFDVCYATTKEVAEKIVSNREYYGRFGVMGTKSGCDVQKRTLVIFKDEAEFVDKYSTKKVVEKDKFIEIDGVKYKLVKV